MKKNYTLILILFFSIFFIQTIAYSALSTEMNIKGDAVARVDDDIRVSSIKLLEINNNAKELYTSEYSKNTLKLGVDLPEINSSVSYEFVVSNLGSNELIIKQFIDENNNSDIDYELSTDDPIINGGELRTYTLVIKYKDEVVSPSLSTVDFIFYIEFGDRYYEYDYNGNIQTLNVPISGLYKLEVWGAQGGTANEYRGGYGGYSHGIIELEAKSILNIVVGGSGTGGLPPTEAYLGGYNGGGNTTVRTSGDKDNRYFSSGGGATHIAIETEEYAGSENGVLSTLINEDGTIKINSILIVAGGGGGGYQHTMTGYYGIGGDAGGYIGETGDNGINGGGAGTGGTQTEAGFSSLNSSTNIGGFGYGGNSGGHGSAGGGGFYGGGGSNSGTSTQGNSGGGGGSSYIGNSLLTNKCMYGYELENISDEENIKTVSTDNFSDEPISTYAKVGNGYAKITLISAD